MLPLPEDLHSTLFKLLRCCTINYRVRTFIYILLYLNYYFRQYKAKVTKIKNLHSTLFKLLQYPFIALCHSASWFLFCLCLIFYTIFFIFSTTTFFSLIDILIFSLSVFLIAFSHYYTSTDLFYRKLLVLLSSIFPRNSLSSHF